MDVKRLFSLLLTIALIAALSAGVSAFVYWIGFAFGMIGVAFVIIVGSGITIFFDEVCGLAAIVHSVIFREEI
jgi:hypothetical protein